jgi:hypothetical protein
MFEPEIYLEHMTKLIDYVGAFFTDIISETLSREEMIFNHIASKLINIFKIMFINIKKPFFQNFKKKN